MKTFFAVVLTSLVFIPPPPDALWQWPTTGAQIIVQDYQAPPTPWGAGHRGLDIQAGSPELIAPTSGVISYSGFVVNRGVLSLTTSKGAIISFEPVAALVESGQRVSAGEVIAEIEEGHCSMRCVHMGLRVDGRYRSPRLELGVAQRAILVPWE